MSNANSRVATAVVSGPGRVSVICLVLPPLYHQIVQNVEELELVRINQISSHIVTIETKAEYPF